MARITFVGAGDEKTTVEASTGASVMLAAVQNGIRGIEGECGGSMTCVTCHVYVADDDTPRMPKMAAEEDELLDYTTSARLPQSRLSCQLVVTDDLDGLTVSVPQENT
jgi:2Fe-2S ferredoxin